MISLRTVNGKDLQNSTWIPAGTEPDEEIYFAYSASLRIFGEISSLVQISARLGVKPTNTHRKGGTLRIAGNVRASENSFRSVDNHHLGFCSRGRGTRSTQSHFSPSTTYKSESILPIE